MFRRQLPVYSPLTWRAVVAGVRAAVAGAGDATRQVAEHLATTFDASDVLLTDSGTSALTLALRGVRRVALPAYACYDVATAAEGARCEVAVYDVDPGTLGPDPDSLRSAIQGAGTVVVVAPLYGVPVDMDMVEGIASAAGVTVIEDAAQAGGARFAGRAVGSFGCVSVLSFGRGKGTTGAGGGALLAHDAEGRRVLDAARGEVGPAWRGLARLPSLVAQWVLGRPAAYGIPASLPFLHLGETVHRRPVPSRRASALSLGTLAQTLSLAAREAAARRSAAASYVAAARHNPSVNVPVSPTGGEPGYLRFPVVCSEAKWPAVLAARRLGLMPGYPKALSDLPGFAARVTNRNWELKGARVLARRLATLPTHSRVSEREQRELQDWLRPPSPGC